MSLSCAPARPESPRSMAGDPCRSCRLPLAFAANRGSPWTPLAYWPVAFCMALRVVYFVPANAYIVPAVVR
jgi:hypothetical protein